MFLIEEKRLKGLIGTVIHKYLGLDKKKSVIKR